MFKSLRVHMQMSSAAYTHTHITEMSIYKKCTNQIIGIFSAAWRSMWLPGCALGAPQLQAVVLWPRAAGISESPAMAIHRALWNELLIWVYLQPDRCCQPQNLPCLPSFPWQWLRNKSCTGFSIVGSLGGSWRCPRYISCFLFKCA